MISTILLSYSKGPFKSTVKLRKKRLSSPSE
ncbi:BgTH12-02036 [Blumeria graminis f. sp. triticale]|uniref:BgTH12-02036 n=1 Tax=Blumeria graminis f. sp. triticale TaxID=1689686 RepID=A0A9W4CZK1_BLUGR|nr:BgTH12-02036 [Blumeria graminis f. sp. triticale]